MLPNVLLLTLSESRLALGLADILLASLHVGADINDALSFGAAPCGSTQSAAIAAATLVSVVAVLDRYVWIDGFALFCSFLRRGPATSSCFSPLGSAAIIGFGGYVK